MITEAEVLNELKTIETEAETEVKKGVAIAGQFLCSTLSALAKDPTLTAAIQAGFSGALAGLLAVAETGGAAALPAAAIAAGRSLVVSCGGTAEHELVTIVAGELHAAAAAPAAAIPQVVNP